jgi:hypothetical protein
MRKVNPRFVLVAVIIFSIAVGVLNQSAHAAGVFITEFNSNSGDGNLFEYAEFTNLSAVTQDLTNWSEDDSTREVGKHSGHMFSDTDYYGVGNTVTSLAPGQSFILTEANPDDFRTYWWGSPAAAPANLKILGPYSNDNLNRQTDEVNLYGSGLFNIYGDNTVITTSTERLTYTSADATSYTGTSGNGIGRYPGSPAAIGLNRNDLWANSVAGDGKSFAAAGNSQLYGSPGTFNVGVPLRTPGDFNLDGHVNAADLKVMLSAMANMGNYQSSHSLFYYETQVIADVNQDGLVNNADIQFLINELKTGGGTISPVPEPATGVLAFIGAAALMVVASRKRTAINA